MTEKNEIRRLLELGKENDATHLVLFNDMFEYSTVSRFVKPTETVDEIIHDVLRFGNAYKIEAIYNYDLDLEEQLKEGYPYHKEPSSRSIDLLKRALDYATTKHDGKYRKGYDHKPYITHPIEVSNYVENYMKYEPDLKKYKIVALLHDTLENTDATYDEEKELFGEDIANTVLELTNDNEDKKRLGKDIYLANKMTSMKDKTLIVKLCDRLHNVSELDTATDEFNEKYTIETIYIINYLLLNRELNKTHLKLINDIMNKIKEVSRKPSISIKPIKKELELKNN